MTNPFAKFRRDEAGSTIIEMAVLLPVLITMLIGVFQAGMYLQAQNAVRGVAGEMSRFMAVEAQKGNGFSDEDIELKAMAVAVSAPYLLHSEGLQVFIENEETQSMDRVRRIDVRMKYKVPNLLGFTDVPLLNLDYTRSVFIPGADLPDPDPVDPGTVEEPVFGT
ncbi:TadE/TadG family type IV pilus assembly protein [Croceicoccus pelagius]|uniref:TadE-like domain-containing protein n=1 Tax=Croceicoccus pelagius TaxID=1703341 RepID=A0A916YI01_9SPHN|nr:TadE family protein [Croceicoccus pelagius]GGD46548.1 hypothetical protein GCM10010989_20980 [Croceicoccus pelagius]